MPPDVPEPTTVATSSAALQILSFGLRITRTFTDSRNGLYYAYEPTITLRETGGQSAVTLDSIHVVGLQLGAWALAATGCRGDGWAIAAGGTQSLTIHPVCDISGRANAAGEPVRLTVIYRDDRGDVGQVTGYTTVIGLTGTTTLP